MGKASKWLQKLLTRKREDKEENKDTPFSSEDAVLPTAIFPGTPNQKRRWSFGKSAASTDNNNHKTSRSLDAIDSRILPLDSLEYRSEQNHDANQLLTFFVAAKYENQQRFNTTVPVPHNEASYTAAKQFRAIADAAATKIQAFFRAHLARKALKALKGLVKIQALVRGHLVRKQTSEMLRCMNALMSIQVRARVQRIQMTEEPPLKLTHRERAHDQLRRGNSDNLNLPERRGSSRWNKDRINHQQIQTREHEFITNYSERILVSNQENQFHVHPNQSPLTDTSCSQYDELFYGTPSRIFQQKYKVSNTQSSSRTNLRSCSEPKQRPLKQKTMRSTSSGGMTTTPDNRDQNQSLNGKKKQPPWSIKRYRGAKSSKDIEYVSNRRGASSFSYYRTPTHASMQ